MSDAGSTRSEGTTETAGTAKTAVASPSGDGDVVVVIGASSGIGRATALRFASQGARLLLVSRSRPALEVAATACRMRGSSHVETAAVDVNDEAGLAEAIGVAMSRWGRIDVVVHTATVMAYGTIEQVPAEVFEQVVDTAIHGTANVARVVLPVFRRQRRGSLIIVSSLLASITAPTMGAYAAAKWGQLAVIRTLQIETRGLPDVHISAVAPGGVNTPIYYQAATFTGSTGRPPPPTYSPDRVARAIIDRVGRPRRLVQSGIFNPLIIAGFRLFPPVFDALVGPLLGILGTSHDQVEASNGNVFEARPDLEATEGRRRSG